MRSKLGAEVPAAGEDSSLPEVVKALNTEVAGLAQQYIDLQEGLKIRDAVAKVLQASAAGNKFLQVCAPSVMCTGGSHSYCVACRAGALHREQRKVFEGASGPARLPGLATVTQSSSCSFTKEAPLNTESTLSACF